MKKTFALLAAAAVLVLSGCYTTHDKDKYTITQVTAADEGAPAYPGTPRVAPHMVHKH